MIRMIAACDRDMIIGVDNKLPWKPGAFKGDLAYFKALTENSVVVMGWNTWLSLPNKPLSNRVNIVLHHGHREGVYDFHTHLGCGSIDTIINISKHINIWIIGGASIYKQMMPYADEIIITMLNASYLLGNPDKKDSVIKFPRIIGDWKTEITKHAYNPDFCIHRFIRRNDG